MGFPSKNTGVGCRFLLQEIIPTQGLNPHLLHLQVYSFPLSHHGSPNFGVHVSFDCLQPIPLPLPLTSAAAAAKSRQSCPTLCDPTDGSPPGSCVWDSPGKNTGVGCHFLLQGMKVKSEK